MLIDLSEAELITKLNEAITYNDIFPILVVMKKKGIDISEYVEEITSRENNKRIKSELNQLLEMNKGLIIRYDINNLSEEEQIENVKANPYLIFYISKPTPPLLLEIQKEKNLKEYYIHNVEEINKYINEINNYPEDIQLQVIGINSNIFNHIKNTTKDFLIKATSINGFIIRNISSPSEEVQISAVKQNGLAIQFIKNPSLTVQTEAVNQNFNSIKYIDNPSEEIILIAIRKNRSAIQYIKNPSIELQTEIIIQDFNCIKYIDNPPEEIQLMAVKQNSRAIEHIKNPSTNVKVIASNNHHFNTNDLLRLSNDSEGQYLITKINGLNIQYIKNPPVDIQMLAVRQNGCAIQYINNPSTEVQLEAVKNDSMAIRYIKKPEIEVMLQSVRNDPYSIQYMDALPLEIQLEAVRIDGEAIKFINQAKLEVQLEAVRNSEFAIRYISDPPLEVQMESIKYFPKSIIFIKEPKIKSVDLYNELKEKPPKIENTEKEKIKAFYEEVFSNLDNYLDKSLIINWKDNLANHINSLCEKIAIQKFYLATGFAFKSGFDLIENSVETVIKNKGDLQIIIGSLQKYDGSPETKVLGMDSETAVYINKLIENGAKVRTYKETFYHGKFYCLEGEKYTAVITGSSNLSVSGFKTNRELNNLYIFEITSRIYEDYKNWFEEFWSDCSEITKLDPKCFSNYEAEYNPISKLKITKVEEDRLKSEVMSLTDEEVKYRFGLWLNKQPNNIYTELAIESLQGYLLFEYYEYNLIVLESFQAGNSYYYFYNQEVNSLVNLLRQASKTEIFSLSQMHKRGYHIKNNVNLKIAINNLFIKKYTG